MSRAEGFAAVPNWMIRDESIDGYEIAVYTALASHTGPGGVRPSQATLAREARCSERKVRDTLQKLIDRGVIEVVRRRRRGAGAGRHGALTDGYRLLPHGPLADTEFAENEEPAPDAGRSEQPAPDDRPTGTRVQSLLSIEEEPVEEEPVLLLTGASFEDFWVVWPRKNSKRDAEKAWARAIKKTQPDVIVAAARAYAESPYRPENQFVPYGASWLNGERWNDPLPEPARGGVVSLGPNDRVRAGIEMGARLQAQFDAGRRALV